MALFLVVHFPSLARDFYLKDYIKSSHKDVTPAVYQLISEARGMKSIRIFIDEGQYHFYPEKAFEKYCYVSNHDNTMRRIAFPIIGFENLEIIGKNADFIFHGPMMPFDIEDSKNIKISGINIDWHVPLHSEAMVVANNQKRGTFDLQIDEGYPYVIRNNKLFFIKEGYEHDLGRAILFDPERKAVAYNTRKYTPLDVVNTKTIRNKAALDFQNFVDVQSPSFVYQDAEWALKAEEIAPGIVRIATTKELPPVGLVLVCKGRNGNNRIANAFHILKSSNVDLRDINIYSAGGMGVLGERSEDILLENVKIQTNPADDRMVSTSADATHFTNCRGKITLNNCVFKQMLDDATNVHSAYVIVDEVLESNQLGVRIGHYQQAGSVFAAQGDRIGFVDRNESTNPQFTSKVKSIDYVNDRYYTITFEDEVANRVTSDFVLENLDWYPELTITNCTIANNRARGILLSTPKKTVVENNYFSTMMAAILIPVELSWWYESGQAQDVLIRNNTFEDCCYGGSPHPVILIHTGLDKEDYIFGKIVIDKNEFNQFDSAILHANGVKELQFTHNKIAKTDTFDPLFPQLPVLKFDHVESVKVSNIDYDGNLSGKSIFNAIENKEVVF